MLNTRTHTFFLKNLEKNHPLKKLYKNSNPSEKRITNFTKWKQENDKFNDGYITNTRIVFD